MVCVSFPSCFDIFQRSLFLRKKKLIIYFFLIAVLIMSVTILPILTFCFRSDSCGRNMQVPVSEVQTSE